MGDERRRRHGEPDRPRDQRGQPDAPDVGSQPSGIAFGDGALWVTDAIGAELLRVDPASGEVQTRRDSPGSPPAWPSRRTVCGSRSPRPGSRASIPRDLSVTLAYQSVGNGPTAVLSAFGSIWVANQVDGTVSRLEPSTGQQQATIPVGDGPNALGAAATGSLWVANEFGGSITAIDPVTNTADPAVPVGGAAVSLAADGEGLWLAVGASAAEHRGGTLTVSSGVAIPTSLDPGVNYDVDRLADPLDHERRAPGVQEGRRPGRLHARPGPRIGAPGGVCRRIDLPVPAA